VRQPDCLEAAFHSITTHPLTHTITQPPTPHPPPHPQFMPMIVALLAKESPVGYQGLMWVTLVAMLLQFVCLVPVMTTPVRGRGGPSAAAEQYEVSIPGSDSA